MFLLYKENQQSIIDYIFYKNGNLKASGLYVNEIKDSTWNYYNRDSVLILQEVYSKGRLNGLVKTFYDEGSIYEEKNYENNVLNGIWKQYFLNGQLKLQGKYINGKREGNQMYYFPNGNVYSSGLYKNDVKIGEWQYNNEEGVKDTTIIYNE